MRRLGGLLLKELWQHGGVLLLLAAFVAAVQGILLLGSAVGPRTITMLEAHATFTRVFLPLLGIALGHRLVVREYHAHTQRFLEALPLYRGEVLVTKLGLGLFVLAGAVTVSLAFAAAIALVKEPLTWHWLTLIFVRTQVFALTLWSVLFTMGLLGRWRIPVYLAMGLVLVFLDQGTDFEVARFGPFGLVSERLILERHAAPWAELGTSLAIAAIALGLGVALALLDEGSVAESLAKPMSRRERVAVGVVLCFALIAWDVVDPKHDKAPFDFEGDAVVRREGLAVLYLDEANRGDAEALADAIAADLARAHDALGYEEPFGPVHVALRTTLEADGYEEVELEGEDDGLLVRAGFSDPAFDARAFRAWVLERAIERATDGRAAFEPNAWVRTGAAALLVYGDEAPDPGLAAFWARHRRPRYAALERFWRTEERFGPEVASAVATSAAFAFVSVEGEPAWRAFASEVLAPPAPGVFAMAGPSPRERFEAATDAAAFEARWAASLRTASSGVPRATASLSIEPEEGLLRSVRWGVRFRGAPPPDAFCALLHAPLGPFDEVVTPSDLSREEVPCAELGEAGSRLVGRYSAADRVLLAIELEVPAGRVRLLAERRELD
ncbi:MAG: ABC transporter permease subunit [Sandaracinaceae bacterium]|nr:ABC transporter permease subunit [Sandaracinaceae bacterium]